MTSSPSGEARPRPTRLVSPGPTPIPPQVAEALARPLLHHRVPEFMTALRNVHAGVKELARTTNPVLLLGCTGTGAMESAVLNLCVPGDTVAVVTAGYFGERWVALAERYGCDVVPVRYEWGAVPAADDLERTLRANPAIKVVYLVHSETSTGVILDLEAFGSVTQAAGAILVADAVSSLAAVPIETDAWGVDVLVSSSHKALMTPPGVAILTVSDRALQAAKAAPLPRYYLDWVANLHTQWKDEPETWFSATTSLIVALEAALECIKREGFDAVYRRHVGLGRRCRAGVKAAGLELFSPDDDSAAVLTAVSMPAGVRSTRIVNAMHDRFGVTVADGEERLKGNIIRIGHLGYISEEDVDLAVESLVTALADDGELAARGAA
jgi:aspartate aminotransferase-like enzyme